MSIKVKQHDITDCGAACLASVAAYYKLMLPLARVRQLAGTTKKGTSVAGLLEALKTLGFDARGARGDLSALINVPKPAIVHVMPRAGFHHYAVVYGASEKHIELMDPADGRIHLYEHQEFLTQWTGVMVLVLPGDQFVAGNRKRSVWLRLWRLAQAHRDVMIQALAGSLIFTLIGLCTSVFVQKIVDYVLPDSNRNLLNLMGLMISGLLVVQTFVSVSKSMMILRAGQRLDARLILGYYAHLLRLPQSFFDRMRVGEITSRVGDAIKIRVFINDAAVNVAVNVFIVLFSFALMFTHHWKLALGTLGALPGFAMLYAVANYLNRRVERNLMERAADLESHLVESVTAVRTIKSFCLEDHADRKTESRFLAVLQSVYASGKNSILLGESSEFLSKVIVIALLWVGAGFALEHAITPGELLSFYALVEYFSVPATGLINLNKTVQGALIASDRLFEIMDLEPEQQGDRAVITAEHVGDIVFRDVQFRYDASVNVFEKLSMIIPKNSVTAIVGESGCGKSTLLSVLQGMYPIQGGSVHIGSCDIRYTEHASLRKLVSVVPQRIDLFAGTILENIAVGRAEPDVAHVMTICSSLQMLDFIERLPQGLYTWIGENGASLSGGQKQRIAIARALYVNPEILALDEATSALDAHAEKHVHQMIDMMRERNKTVVIVAHRLSTIMRADKIILLENGKVGEEGTHDELIHRKGVYYSLWRQQFQPAQVSQ